MYLVIRSEGLGNQDLVIGPFSDDTQRSMWRNSLFNELTAVNEQTENEDHALSATVWDGESFPKLDIASARLALAKEIVGELAALLH